jgi:Glycosyltransferase family 87
MATVERVERAALLVPRLPASRAAAAQRVAGLGALAGLLVASLVLAAGAGGEPVRFFVPSAPPAAPGWLRGPLAPLGITLTPSAGAHLLVVMALCYAVALCCARALPVRAALVVVVGLHVVFALAPPLFSADVFGYIDYARLGSLHGLDPYTHGAAAAPHDAAAPFVRWHDIASPYGPLFTALSYPLAHVPVAVALWTLKAVMALAGLACVALTWLIVRRSGRDPLAASLFVGLNPLLLAYGVGGAHNDLLLVAVVLGAVALASAGNERLAGAGVAVAAGLKASAGLVAPFLLLGARRRGAVLVGALAGAVLVVAPAVALFGHEAFGFVRQVHGQQHLVADGSVPSQLSLLLGHHGITSGVRLGATVFTAGSLAWLLWRTYRGMDWVAAAGWAMLVVLVGTAWLVPWYVVWALPLAAVSDDRRLRLATLAFCAFILVVRVRPWVL